MKRIQIGYDPDVGKWDGADFIIRVDTLTAIPPEGLSPLDVHGASSCWQRGPGLPPRTTDIPHRLDDEIRRIADAYPCRLLIGNDVVELLFHHVCSIDAKANVDGFLQWGDWAYNLTAGRLVLAPMFIGLALDLMSGRRFLTWAAERRVPLIMFEGWRLLFPNGTLPLQREREQDAWQFYDYDWHPYRYPYVAFSDAFRETGVEVWTGAGYAGGLQSGSFQKAQDFGFQGVLTTREAWEKGG